MILTRPEGAEREDVEISRWQERAASAEAKAKAEAYERLGWSYVAKARRTLDPGYYKLAEKTADVMDAQFGRSAPSQLLRGHVLHNLHRFAEAETLARAMIERDASPAVYALLSDVLVEQGRLPEALAAVQRLADLKPGPQAFTRIAHVRWLRGDLAGARDAMEMALRATAPQDAEAGAWMLTRLSGFFLQSGDRARALALAKHADRRAPGFAPALLACGRALVATGDLTGAVSALERAAKLNPLPEYQWWLADALRATGRAAEAAVVEQALRAHGASSDPRTYALFLATRGEEPATAVRLAQDDLARRQDFFTHDALAWALAAQGDLAGAETAMRAALAGQTRDARLALHAGEIARRAGRTADAAAYFDRARAEAFTLTPSERGLLGRREP